MAAGPAMPLIRSAAGGFDRTGWRGVAVSCLFGCLFPSVLGAAVIGTMTALGSDSLTGGQMTAFSLATLAVVSPLLIWPGFVLALPVVAWLLRRGWYGWLPAVGLGSVMGGALAALAGSPLAASFGVVGFVLQRWMLGRLYPAAV